MKKNNATWYLKNNGMENHEARTNATTTTYLDMLEANDISHYPAAAAYVKYYIHTNLVFVWLQIIRLIFNETDFQVASSKKYIQPPLQYIAILLQQFYYRALAVCIFNFVQFKCPID